MTSSPVRLSPLFLAILAATVAGGALTLVDASAAATAGVVLVVLGGWAVSLCLHEFGHAAVAYRGGDLSVRDKGYLTLDPRRYTDPVLSLLLPILLLMAGGIPLPGGAVWINRHALRSRAVESGVSLAGPLTNLALGGLLVAAVSLTQPPLTLAAALSYLAYVQIIAFVLNMLPVPGLDGYGALEPHLSAKWRHYGSVARPWAPLALFAVLLGLPQIGFPYLTDGLFTLTSELFRLIGGDAMLAAWGGSEFRFWR
ncbi:site-2 protease family protein [Actinoalloteichus sp. AHMU CJ021]|uniref:Zn-dependent protease (Includes SpoIVFB) n=1 Tax=Actinoalloteichus caeruleus DSM 43889 TaxID=1120930 RepID=A0ABT1JNG8_ACTCY|nr:site-2 protease family protein [Actinoalloteichus caeruleus]AUS79397.1 site-2 protease family protein [Actinoalloteichus sp. AHMU CJ021]MCP2333704.1 Zn-dependent protease (includes SpoIVFB) [Actinoalloteichus caeruleus DSM 43889]